MTTLLLIPPGLPRALPRRPDIPNGPTACARSRRCWRRSASSPLVRDQAPEGDLDTVTLCHNEHYVSELRHIAPKERPGPYRRRHLDVAGHLGGGDARRRRRGRRDRRGDDGQAPQRLRRDAAARPSRRDRQPMGFCFFNHAAIAARHAQRKYGIARAAVVDFDVHHGNGTQDIFWADPTVMYCSTHQMPLFPGTGATRRARRARHHRQCAAAPRRRRRQIPRRVRERDPAAARTIQPRTDHHLGGLRRALSRSAGLAQSAERRTSAGSRAS